MPVNKVEYGNQTLIDITDTTAVASDVAQGKYFYAKDGTKTQGTASSGGASVASGTWTPSTDTLGPSFDVGIDATNFVIYATSAVTGSSKKCAFGAVCDFAVANYTRMFVATNNNGASYIVNTNVNWFSKSGTTITCTNKTATNTSGTGYWKAGTTYKWYAW